MSEERFLLLDSRDNKQYDGQSSDCIFHLQNSDLNGINTVELLNFSCPLTMYNVNSTNNTLYFNDGLVDRIVTLPPSNYDVYSLIAAVDLAMNSVSAVVFVTSYTNELMKITVTGLSTFSFTFGTNTLNSAAKILGFRNENTVSALAHQGNNVINLSIPLYILIKVDGFSSALKASNPFDKSTFVVSTVGNNSDILTWTAGSFYKQKVKCFNNNVTNLHVTLRDYYNQSIDLNGSHYSMLLKLNP